MHTDQRRWSEDVQHHSGIIDLSNLIYRTGLWLENCSCEDTHDKLVGNFQEFISLLISQPCLMKSKENIYVI